MISNITDGTSVVPALIPGSVRGIAHDLALVLAYRCWDGAWEPQPAPVPGCARVRLVGHGETMNIDLMRRAEAWSRWPDLRDALRRSRNVAAMRGETHFLMTERSVGPVLRANLVRLMAARPRHPERSIESAICAECPPDSVISYGILVARAGRLGIDAQSAETAINWLLSVDALRGDLTQPLGRSFLLRRRWRYGRRATPPQPAEQRRPSPPPWRLPD